MNPQLVESLARRNRVLTIWLAVVTVLLVVSFAFNAAWAQAANDPPIKVAQATLNDLRGGYGQKQYIAPPLAIDSDSTAKVLAEATVSMSTAHEHLCLATASGEIDRSSDGNAILQFTITMDSMNGVANKPAHRRVEFQPYASDGEDYKEVTSVLAFAKVSGSHTFRFLGRKNIGVSAPANVSAASLTVICLKQ